MEIECHICNGTGCYMCQGTSSATPNASNLTPVCREIEVDKLIELLQILDRAKHPTVTFCEDIEQMRKEAAKKSEVNLHNAIVMLNDVIAE